MTREGKVVWDFVYPGEVYRSYRHPPDHPGLAGLDLTPWRTAYMEAVAGGEPLARSAFDLYALDGLLIYVKEQCEQDDITHRFFLRVYPERADDFPESRRERGHEKMDFEFFLRGALFDGKCAASVSLPDYAIASIRTGQFVNEDEELWSAEFQFGG